MPNAARSGVVDCGANTYSTGASDTCTTCPDGGHSGAGASSCVSTPPGQFWSGSTDVNCPDGTFSESGAASEEECGACDGAGQFSDAGSAFCSTAGAGKKPNSDRSGEENCPTNTFSVGASNTCTDCSGGHSGAGASSCVSTPPGQYWSGTADVNCPAGTFSESGASSLDGCAPCDGPGQFSPTGSSYCSVAGAGQVPTGKRTDSIPCPKNHFSTGAVNSCTPCTNGHSPVGSVACISTPVGYYFNETDSSDLPCPAGRHSTGAASIEECQLCEDGFIAASPGSGFCSVCSAGTHSNTNNTECVDCGIGKMSGTAASTCELCENGKFTKAQGSSECTLCTDVVRKSTGSSNQCYCKPGWYLAASGDSCEEMMEGAADNTPRATLAELPLEEGFWRATDSSLEVKSCMVPEACVGGNSTDEYCREGHTGPYCNVCEDNYSKDVFGLCNSCAGEGGMMSVLLTILTLIAMIVAAYFFNKKVLKKYKKEVRGMKAAFRIMFVSYQILAVLPR